MIIISVFIYFLCFFLSFFQNVHPIFFLLSLWFLISLTNPLTFSLSSSPYFKSFVPPPSLCLIVSLSLFVSCLPCSLLPSLPCSFLPPLSSLLSPSLLLYFSTTIPSAHLCLLNFSSLFPLFPFLPCFFPSSLSFSRHLSCFISRPPYPLPIHVYETSLRWTTSPKEITSIFYCTYHFIYYASLLEFIINE